MINQHIKDEAIRDRSALQCSFHSKWKLPCSSPLMRQIEAVSKYALDVLAVRPDYILNLKLFKSTVDPKTLCYGAGDGPPPEAHVADLVSWAIVSAPLKTRDVTFGTALEASSRKIQDECDYRINRRWCVHLGKFPFAHEAICKQCHFT
jgi:hypothetical protein